MIKKITTILNSPLGYKYKCVFIYNYSGDMHNKINGTFYIGNPKTKVEDACVTISVFFPSTNNRLIDDSIASLILVKYYETCAENKVLQQGEGTVDMINTSMSFVKQICPFIKEFKLNDASTKRCENGTIISLPYFYITQKGMTWYEGRFGAYLKEPYYTSYKNDIMRIMNTNLPSFETFCILYIKNTQSYILDEIKTIYMEEDTVKVFFNKLYDKYDKKLGCIILQSWIDNFMSIVGLQKYVAMSDWYISSDTIPSYKFRSNLTNIYKINTFNETRKRHPWNN
jgi:hypothetical protein